MKLKITEQAGNKIKFNIKGINTQLANALRRTIISGIPVLAIEKVSFYENSSVMGDEVLAHRMGLMPLKTDLGSPEAITLSLKAKGPKTVYSKELKPKVSVYDNMPIIKLAENQELKLEAEAVLGTARDHVKWQAGLASYTKNDDDSYDFFVESYGQLSPKEMVLTAINTLNEGLDEFKTALKESKK